jgi:hypothetical protein
MGRKPPRIHRDPLVRRIARILDTGRPTRFAFEGACRHGLRSRLCLSGERWTHADQVAGVIITLALHRIGASRPTWQQGQPDPVDRQERWSCLTCGGLIDSESARWRYCSDECKAIAISRATESRMRADAKAARAAFWAARANGGWLTRDCAHCRRPFRPTNEGPRGALQRYCSRACYMAVKTVDRHRTCAGCGQGFDYQSKDQRFCSKACANRAESAQPGPQRSCPMCGQFFTDRSRAGIRQYCSNKCMKRHHRALRCEAA